MGTKLKYVGDGDRWLPGVPLADHEVETKDEADRLVASGLYKRQTGKPKAAAEESD